MPLPIHHVLAAAPRPVTPYSHAVEVDKLVFVTGQLPADPAAPDAPLAQGIEAQTHRVMENLLIVLTGIGLQFAHVTMARIYLKEFERDYAGFNSAWGRYFTADKMPARTTVGVAALGLGALVEVDLVACRP